MEKIRTISGRIDRAFSSLLMANNVIEKIIPDSDDEYTRTLAAQFVAELIISAVDHLTPILDDELEIIEFPVSASPTFYPVDGLDGSNIIDTVDIDTQIERHIRHKHSVQTGTLRVR